MQVDKFLITSFEGFAIEHEHDRLFFTFPKIIPNDQLFKYKKAINNDCPKDYFDLIDQNKQLPSFIKENLNRSFKIHVLNKRGQVKTEQELENDLPKIIEDWCNQPKNRPWKNTRLISDQEFKILFNFLKKEENLSPVKWALIFWGLIKTEIGDITPMLNVNQASTLCDFINEMQDDEKYRWFHSFGWCITFPYKLLDKAYILRYYCLASCMIPIKHDEVSSIWSRRFEFVWNVGKFIVGDCLISCDPIDAKDPTLMCNNCANFFHVQPAHKWAKKSSNCPVCKSTWNNKTISYNNFGILCQSPNGFKLLQFEDFIKE